MTKKLKKQLQTFIERQLPELERHLLMCSSILDLNTVELPTHEEDELKDKKLEITIAELIQVQLTELEKEGKQEIGADDYQYLVVAEILKAFTQLTQKFLPKQNAVISKTEEYFILLMNKGTQIQIKMSNLKEETEEYLKLEQELKNTSHKMNAWGLLTRTFECLYKNKALFNQLQILNEQILLWKNETKEMYDKNSEKITFIQNLSQNFETILHEFCITYAKNPGQLQEATKKLIRDFTILLDDKNNKEILGTHKKQLKNCLTNIALAIITLGLVFAYSKVKYGDPTFFTNTHSAKKIFGLTKEAERFNRLIPVAA